MVEFTTKIEKASKNNLHSLCWSYFKKNYDELTPKERERFNEIAISQAGDSFGTGLQAASVKDLLPRTQREGKTAALAGTEQGSEGRMVFKSNKDDGRRKPNIRPHDHPGDNHDIHLPAERGKR